MLQGVRTAVIMAGFEHFVPADAADVPAGPRGAAAAAGTLVLRMLAQATSYDGILLLGAAGMPLALLFFNVTLTS